MILWVLYGLERLGDTSPPSRIPLTSGCCLNLWNSWYGLLQYQEFLVRARGVRRALPHRRYLPRSTVIYLAPQAPKQCLRKYGRSWAWQALRCGIDRHYALLYADRHFGPCGETACELQCTHAIAVNSAVQALGDTADRREQWQMPRVPNR